MEIFVLRLSFKISMKNNNLRKNRKNSNNQFYRNNKKNKRNKIPLFRLFKIKINKVRENFALTLKKHIVKLFVRNNVLVVKTVQNNANSVLKNMKETRVENAFCLPKVRSSSRSPRCPMWSK